MQTETVDSSSISQLRKMWLVAGSVFAIAGFVSIPLGFILFFAGSIPDVPFIGLDQNELSIVSSVGLFISATVLLVVSTHKQISRALYWSGVVASIVGFLSFIGFLYWVGARFLMF